MKIVRWNIDKSYLKQLEEKGVGIVPTLWQETLTEEKLVSYFGTLDTDQIVIKPRISANADNTFWLTLDNFNNHLKGLLDVFANNTYMVQPFMENIVSEGEFSCFYFNGEYSHTILKTPEQDDFRVQEEHGGRLKTVTPEANLIKSAEFTLSTINEMPLYARVDFVRHENNFVLMEAELIEPSLYFNMDKRSAARFAQAFVTRMETIHQIC